MALTRRAKQWSRILGIAPEQIEAGYQLTAENAAEVVREQAQRVLKDIQQASDTGSLDGYTAKKEQLPDKQGKKVRAGGELIFVPAFRVFIEPSEAHQSIVDGGFQLNVFDLIDSGRKAMPQKSKGRAYILWGWSGQSGNPALKVPTESRTRSKKTGRFGFANKLERERSTQNSYPQRPEPRSASSGGNHNSAVSKFMRQVPYAQAANKGRTGTPRYRKAQGVGAVSPRSGSRFALKPGTRLFSRGPLTAIPPRNLYDRILRTSKDRLKGSGFADWEVILVGKGKK